MAEPLITRAKADTLANRRLVFARLRDREMVTKLFAELTPRYKARPGGYYLRVLRCGFRAGDNAPMAEPALAKAGVELVDRPREAAVVAEPAPFTKAKKEKIVPAAGKPARTDKSAAAAKAQPETAAPASVAETHTTAVPAKPEKETKGGFFQKARHLIKK